LKEQKKAVQMLMEELEVREELLERREKQFLQREGQGSSGT